MNPLVGLRPWLEISRSALEHNVQLFRTILQRDPAAAKPRLGAVLKANAYGHGLEEVASVIHSKVDVFYVILPQDALTLRALEEKENLPQKQIVVIGAIASEELLQLTQKSIDVAVTSQLWRAHLRDLRNAKLKARARCHLFLDTGLSREGFKPGDAESISFLSDYKDCADVVGVLSHFANTEDVTEQDYAMLQLREFEAGVVCAEQVFGVSLERHFAATAATFVLPQSHLDTVRVGIGTYGLWPSMETKLSAKIVLGETPKLRPALSWYCPSMEIKTLPVDSYVGYGCTYRCDRETTIGVFPVGYFDGLPRLMSGKAYVLVEGRRCPVLGRIMMNHIVVDLTGVPVKKDRVIATLLGKCGSESLTADTLAANAQTISYEIVARLGAHLPRLVVD